MAVVVGPEVCAMLGCVGALAGEESFAVRCTHTDMLAAALTLSDPLRVLEDVCVLCAGRFLKQDAGPTMALGVKLLILTCVNTFGRATHPLCHICACCGLGFV